MNTTLVQVKQRSEIQDRRENMQDEIEQVEEGYREVNREEDRHRKIKSTYITPQVWNPPTGLPTIPIGANFYIIQAPSEVSR